MIVLRQKEFVHPVVGRVLNTRLGKKAMDGAIRVAKSPGYQNIEKNTAALGKTVSQVTTNPGAAVRRAAAGTVINPGLATAVAADTAVMAAVPAYAAVPVGMKHAVMALPAATTKSTPAMQKVGRDMMRNNGQSRASRIGRAIEYGVNKAALGASRIGSIMSGMG